MPAIIAMILRMMAGMGGAAAAQKWAPGLMRTGLKAINPGMAANVMEGTGRGMRALRGAGRFGGMMGGFGAGEALASTALGDIHDQGPPRELPPDSTVDDIGMAQMPWLAEEQAGLQRVQVEEQLRAAMEQMGIDYDEFMLSQGGIV